MFAAILKSIAALLSLWEAKEKDKYNSQVLDIKRRYLDEYNKPRGQRSTVELDHLRLELKALKEALENQIILQTGTKLHE